MTISLPTQFVTTPEALASSIETDKHVLQWFTYLIVQPSIQSRFRDEPPIQKLYRDLKKIVILQHVLYLSLLAAFFLIIYTKQYFYLLGILVLIYPYVKLHIALKNCVRDISMSMILKDFEDSALRQKTLYQISEFYSRQCHIPSLVDQIFAWNNIWRIVLITGFIMNIFVMLAFSLKLLVGYLILVYIVTSCYFVFAIIRTFIIAYHLRIYQSSIM